MAERKQQFRFRLPWFTPQRTTAQPQRPPPTSQQPSRPPSQPSTAVPIQRPAFRPARIAPTQPPPQQSQPPPKAEPQSPSPSTSSAVTEATKSSQSVPVIIGTSPSPANTESPKITSRSTPSFKATTKPPSPSSATTNARKDASQATSSPSIATAKPQSPSRATTESSAFLPSTPSQQPSKPKPSASQTPSQEPEPKVKITSETIEKPNSQDDAIERNHIKVSSPVEGIASREAKDKPVSSIIIDQKPPSKAERDTKEIEDVKEKVQEIPEEEKTNKATFQEEPMQMTIIEAPSTGRDTEKTSKREEKVATTRYIGKQIKTVIPSQSTEGNTGTSFQKPFSLTEEEAAPRQREIKEDIYKLVRTVASGPQLDGKHVTVITLTGENKGASMQLSSETTKREGSVHIHRGYQTDPDESPESTTDAEVPANGKRLTGQMASTPTAYVNSNVQSVNNSIILEASVTERSPGIHLSYSQNTPEAIKSNGKSESVHNRKAEFIPTLSEKLTHQPVVRRRCLRGLFMEPSDSEPDNPDKPRRHGCRYSCGKTSKDKEIM